MIVYKREAPQNISQVISRSIVADVVDAETRLAVAARSSTEVWTAEYNGEIACVMGLCGATILSDRAYLWMLHTDVVEKHKFLFVRHSQMWVQEALKRYSEIWGIALIENRAGIRWLKWLGAEFEPATKGFARFTIKAKN